eukprot:11227532-Lingulodinium_polyedra.AAC.1
MGDTPERATQKRVATNEAENDEKKLRTEAASSSGLHSKQDELIELMKVQMIQNQEMHKTIAAQVQAVMAMASQTAGALDAITKVMNSHQGAAPTQLVTPTATPAPELKKEEMVKLDKEKKQEMEKVANKYSKQLWKRLKATKRVEKAKEDIHIYEEEKEIYPSGVKPYKAPMDQIELENEWSEVKDELKIIGIDIAKGSTKKEAIAKIHRDCAKWMKKIDLEALEEHEKTMSAEATENAYNEAMLEVHKAYEEMREEHERVWPEVQNMNEEEKNKKRKLEELAAQECAKDLYNKTLERVKQQWQESEKQAEKMKQIQEDTKRDSKHRSSPAI